MLFRSELVPGNVTDNLAMIVTSRPGTTWDATVYQHVGYNVVSREFLSVTGTETEFSFDRQVLVPMQLQVFYIDGTTGVSTTIYEPEYTIDWITNVVTLTYALNIGDSLRIDVYEVGNGDQLVKSNSKIDPIRSNDTTGFNEIYVDCRYTGYYTTAGLIQPGSEPINVIATATEATTNVITVEDAAKFTLNNPITFQGTTFGGIVENQVYYVKTASVKTNTITISETYIMSSGTAGPTFTLTTDTGSMTAIVEQGTGTTYTDPIIYHNGQKITQGITSTVTKTSSSTNAITCNSTANMIVDSPIVFSDTMFGSVIVPQTVYYVHSIIKIGRAHV